MFVHLHVYSSYSLLSSTITIDSLVTNAKKRNFRAIALTDNNVMYGTIPFYEACKRAGIKPIIGLTASVLHKVNDEVASYPLILLAKNNQGYKNLLKISSLIKLQANNGISLKDLSSYSAGLIAISPGEEGIVESYLLENNYDSAKEAAIKLAQLFSENSFYLSIQNDHSEKIAKLRRAVITVAKETNIELVATNHVLYLNSDDAFAYECLRAIKNNETFTRGELLNESRPQTVNDSEEGRFNYFERTNYLKTAAEMTELFSQYEGALKNSLIIADKCEVTLEFNRQLLPKFPIDDGSTASQLLRSLCEKGMKERYGNISSKHRQRLDYELETIEKMGFSDYFLIVADFMKYARHNNILTGPGRGSAAGSIVAYVLHITDVDPLKYGLIFERFLNPERVSLPDIDIDFPDNRRDEVIRYVAKKYGSLHVAQIITFGTFGARAVIRDVGKAFGYERAELDQLSRFISESNSNSLQSSYESSSKFRDFISQSSRNKLLFEIASKLEGLPRHTSTHAAGLVISDQPLNELVPLQAGHNDIHLTQFSMDYLEKIGLLKMDFLGLKNLSLLEAIVEQVNRQSKEKLNVKKLNFDDEKTFSLLSKGETSGIFQLESPGMQEVLRRLKPSSFEDIVAVNALYRPGPMENIATYICRKHGKEKVVYPHDDLEPILKNTYGVIVYQEQIMQIAARMANFTLGEADLLRKAVSKKQANILQKERAHFVKGATENGYNKNVAEQIYDLIVKFSDYGFNRSHAVAYSMISYQLAYLKAHYPLQFFATLLTSSIGNEGKINDYIEQLRSYNFKMLGPSINKSRYSFYVENHEIRYSLGAIKGVGKVALREIFQARREKYFSSLFDFCLRVKKQAVNRKVIESLIYAGCFDEFGKDRATLLASIDTAMNHADFVQPLSSNESLFKDDLQMITPKYVEVDEMPIKDKLNFEKQVLGTYLSDHPLRSFSNDLEAINVNKIIDGEVNKRLTVAAFITEVKKIRTKKGLPMAFLKISDESSEIDCVVFPDLYRNVSAILQDGATVLIRGKIELRKDRKQLNVQSCEQLESVIDELNKTLYIKITEENHLTEKFYELNDILRKSPGYTKVVLYYEGEKRAVQLNDERSVNVSESLINEVNQLLGEENIILKN